ncbi:hypothetical protein [uncultured Tenacibaculum sp.]|uniref:hypothetical protein n=1 Tax=uncultured Tenacibaculum sp. TaxID=174713 RepID=UPI00262FAF48|nr:hypothetical protein [uncultured Tenacibaculum sp.]
MKSIKLLLVVIAFASSSMTFATNPTLDNKKISVELSQQIQSLLTNPEFEVQKSMNVTVKFTVNDNNEIVVLSVNSYSNVKQISSFIKERLNYKKLTTKVKSKAIFILPVKMISVV